MESLYRVGRVNCCAGSLRVLINRLQREDVHDPRVMRPYNELHVFQVRPVLEAALRVVEPVLTALCCRKESDRPRTRQQAVSIIERDEATGDIRHTHVTLRLLWQAGKLVGHLRPPLDLLPRAEYGSFAGIGSIGDGLLPLP